MDRAGGGTPLRGQAHEARRGRSERAEHARPGRRNDPQGRL